MNDASYIVLELLREVHMRKQRLSVCFTMVVALCLVALPSVSSAGSSLCIDTRSQLVEVRTLRDVPSPVRKLLGVNRPGEGGVADRGGNFNATDVIAEQLPRRRFVLGGVSEQCAVLAVERGGRGYSVDIQFFEKDLHGWQASVRRNIAEPPASFQSLLSAAFDELLIGGPKER